MHAHTHRHTRTHREKEVPITLPRSVACSIEAITRSTRLFTAAIYVIQGILTGYLQDIYYRIPVTGYLFRMSIHCRHLYHTGYLDLYYILFMRHCRAANARSTRLLRLFFLVQHTLLAAKTRYPEMLCLVTSLVTPACRTLLAHAGLRLQVL